MPASARYSCLALALFTSLLAYACTDDLPAPDPYLTKETEVYQITSTDYQDTLGTATIFRRSDGVAVFEISVTGQGSRPVLLRTADAATGGSVLLSLGTTDASGALQVAIDIVGDSLDFDDFANRDAYLVIETSAADTTPVAIADIGVNKLIGDQTIYTLEAADGADVTGQAIFYGRRSGRSLIVVSVPDAPQAYRALLRGRTRVETDTIRLTLNDVSATTGYSFTSPDTYVNGTTVTYTNLGTLDAYLVLEDTDADTTARLWQDIGGNRLTGDTARYTITPTAGNTVAGSLLLQKRQNNLALATVTLTDATGTHPVTLNEGDVTDSTAVEVDLGIYPTSGTLVKNIRLRKDSTSITYSTLTTADFYLQVLAAVGDSTIIATAEIDQ